MTGEIDTRYDDYFAAALSERAASDPTEHVQALKSLLEHVENSLASQELAPDVRDSELALARAAAEKLAGDVDTGLGPTILAPIPPATGWKSRLPKFTKRRAIIAAIAAIVYALPLFFFARESRAPKAVDANGAAIALSLSIGVTALNDEKIALHIMPTSGSLMQSDARLAKDVTLRLDPGSGPLSHTFHANAHLTPWDVTINAVSGDILDYPFDRYRFEIDIDGLVEGKDIAVEAGLGSVPHGIRARLTDIREQGGTADVAIEVRRSGSVIFLAALSTISLLVVAIAALSVAWQVAEQGRKIDFSMMTWVAAFMFVIPAVRGSLPGAPPVGALIDFILFFWLQVLAAIATTTLVVIWMRQKPNL